MKLEHIHMTVNAKISPTFMALPRDDAQRFVDKLMKVVNMKPLGPLNWSDAEDLDFPGQSFVQMITTSHTSLHFFIHSDTDKEIYFDLYSCKCFDHEAVVKLLDDTFGLNEWHGTLYTRASDAKPEVKMIGSSKKMKQKMVAQCRSC
ncbi:S-adenosylmethionine decarboxylase [Candidatus Micrarchaeota archaeon]|nr:S-adenosylmethionine decarboxylase [Candidatus Micrarchaeota archaeon]